MFERDQVGGKDISRPGAGAQTQKAGLHGCLSL